MLGDSDQTPASNFTAHSKNPHPPLAEDVYARAVDRRRIQVRAAAAAPTFNHIQNPEARRVAKARFLTSHLKASLSTSLLCIVFSLFSHFII